MDSASFIPTAIGWILAIAVIIFVLVTIARSVRIIPQALFYTLITWGLLAVSLRLIWQALG